MGFDMYGYKHEEADYKKWLGAQSAEPENDVFSNLVLNEGGGIGSGASYGAQVFNRPYYEFEPDFFRSSGRYAPPMQPSILPENDNVKFLLRCGVLMPTLKGLPKALLRIMAPEHCGVCALGFVNFKGACIHYISKNHNKNVKKWMTQLHNVGAQLPIEIPIRARGLYCELCDVVITSQPIADLHYGGRPHRKIVEGRKLPKNPFLLQENMKERLAKLIRREKKHLKPIEMLAGENAIAVSKPTPPELYCYICKTSVTCLEQMIAHKNGKRHLVKEKRHILNVVLRGGTSELIPAETTTTAEGCQGAASSGLE